jgi:tetratricopeptide (TPR) repeat protein
LVTASLLFFAQLAVVARAPIDTTAGVNFHALLQPDTVYVGQQATYQVGVFIDNELRLRLRHNPEFVPPDPQGMLAYGIGGPVRSSETRREGHHAYEVHVFQRAFFPLSEGRYMIPSAQLVYSLPLSTSFFSREESHTLVAESLTIVVRTPPMAGRPPDYSGAVGDLTIAAHLDSTAARVGDPMLLTVRVTGRGNVKLLPRPAVAVPWGTLVAGQVRVRLDTTSTQVHGTKEFDWLITPRDSGALTFPSVRYPFFDPYTERYEIALTPPSAVRVATGALALADTAHSDAPPPLTLRAAYRGTPEAPFYETPLYLALAVCGSVPALALSIRRRPRAVRRAASSASARLQDLARHQGGANPSAGRRAFVSALRERFALTPTTLTDQGALAHALRLEGVTAATAESAERVLAALDRAAFGAGESLPADFYARAYATYRDVMSEARRPRTTPWRAGRGIRGGASAAVVLMTVALAVAAHALLADTRDKEIAAFDAGVKAYGIGNYRSAALHFAAVAEYAPGAPDAWANAGTAAWSAGDTADAVAGWQHAGRLEPLAQDIHDRLALVRAPQDGPIARPPRVPASLAADCALAAWLLGCLIAAGRYWRRTNGMSLATSVCIAMALGSAIVAVRSDETAAARGLAVIERGTTLYTSPELNAERSARVDAGDVAQTLGTSGLWTRVRLDGDREGWIETAGLTGIERR